MTTYHLEARGGERGADHERVQYERRQEGSGAEQRPRGVYGTVNRTTPEAEEYEPTRYG
jgi:hypothetical protein